MAGPIAAVMRSGFAPSLRMASTVASMMPPSAPFQPACAAPITRASPSQNSTGAQSAVSTPMASPGVLRDDGVGLGRRVALPRRVGDHRIGAVLLEHGDEPAWLRAQQLGDTRAVLHHIGRVVARARPAIERSIDAARDAALAREESVPHPVERGEARRAKLHFVWCDHGARNRKLKCLRREAAGQARSIAARAS